MRSILRFEVSRKTLAIAPISIALALGLLAWGMFGKNIAAKPETVPAPPGAPPPAGAESGDAGAAEQSAAQTPMRAILVTSKPSGATIWINSTNTGIVTPSNVNVPGDGKFILMLKKRGYAPYIEDKPLQKLHGRKLNAVLSRSKLKGNRRH